MRSIVVIPCYNEADRLRSEALLQYVTDYPEDCLLLVNDGSTDATIDVLRQLCERMPESISMLSLAKNAGKAEAVRQGVLKALETDAEFVGYWDADLATPLKAIPDFIATFDENPQLDLVMGSRVKLLGRVIERNPVRHYVGRVFANLASHTLKLAVYDTQCGAKLLRRREWTSRLFVEPFASRWIFDVELLARLLTQDQATVCSLPESHIAELPLKEWRDIPGSKVRPRDFFRALWELVAIRRRYRPHRRVASARSRRLSSASGQMAEQSRSEGLAGSEVGSVQKS